MKVNPGSFHSPDMMLTVYKDGSVYDCEGDFVAQFPPEDAKAYAMALVFGLDHYRGEMPLRHDDIDVFMARIVKYNANNLILSFAEDE